MEVLGMSLASVFFALAAASAVLALQSDEYRILRRGEDPVAAARAAWERNENLRFLIISLAAFVVFRFFFGGFLISAVVTVLFFVFLKFFWANLNFLIRRATLRQAMLRDMDGLINSLVSALQAGYGFLAALKSTEPYVPEPLKSEVRKIVERVDQAKMGIEESLFVFHEKYKLPETRRFVYTMSFASRYSGRDLIPVLKAMATTFRTTYQLQDKLGARTTQIRIALFVLPVLPIIMLLMLYAAMPEAVNLLFTEGRWILLVGFAFIFLAFFWALNMVARFTQIE